MVSDVLRWQPWILINCKYSALYAGEIYFLLNKIQNFKKGRIWIWHKWDFLLIKNSDCCKFVTLFKIILYQIRCLMIFTKELQSCWYHILYIRQKQTREITVILSQNNAYNVHSVDKWKQNTLIIVNVKTAMDMFLILAELKPEYFGLTLSMPWLVIPSFLVLPTNLFWIYKINWSFSSMDFHYFHFLHHLSVVKS